MADLQIPEDFCQQGDPKGKTSHSDGENLHYICLVQTFQWFRTEQIFQQQIVWIQPLKELV